MANQELTLTIDYTESDDQVVAQIREVPQAISFGGTREEARESVLDALRELAASYMEEEPGDPTAGSSERLAITARVG